MKEVIQHSGMEANVLRLQTELLKLPQYEPETHHYFAKGMYMRTIFSPAGTVIVGKKHKTEHFYVVMTGKVRVTMGDEVLELDAGKNGPQILTCPIGTKRAVYVMEDAWRMNVHLNDEDSHDIEKLETVMVEDDPTSPFLADNTLKKGLLS